ncbi:toprim domain-containing protein [Solibacillus sp. FSL H8-0538]|uniref:toprim domain-containing protein n=1 Tax=Solibacillus sp. FSL H8-0538 TaxID=2921400 RepID=UPI0030FACFF4
MNVEKCIIVEGRSDKLKIIPLLAENATILCTNGTISEEDLITLIEPYEHCDLYTMFDADKNGEKLRKLMKRCYSDAIQLVIPKQYIEVAETPSAILLQLLEVAKFAVHK